jgi:hypothetical protein
MNPTAELNLRVAILKELDLPSGLMMPEPTLLNRIRLTEAEPPVMAEFSSALNFLSDHKLVVSVRPDLGGPMKWMLTDAGRAELAMRL